MKTGVESPDTGRTVINELFDFFGNKTEERGVYVSERVSSLARQGSPG